MSLPTQEVNDMLDCFARNPNIQPTVTSRLLKAILLYTEGWMCAQGVSYDIKSKYLGAGVYKLKLEVR